MGFHGGGAALVVNSCMLVPLWESMPQRTPSNSRPFESRMELEGRARRTAAEEPRLGRMLASSQQLAW
jgi:hypothetical protein